VDNTQNQVIIKIAGLPGQGVLKLGGNELSVGSTLAVSQIAQLSYTHNGNQVLSPTTDTFFITVDDGAGGLLVNQAVNVQITPVNQAPSVAGTVTVFEGEQDVSLTANTNLVTPIPTPRGAISGSDPDDTVFTYSITSLPSHGTLKYDGTVISAASVGSPFVVADLSKLTYSHDGSEPTGTPDTFDMRITDSGGGTGVPLSHTSTIEIGIIGNNNDPVLVTNIPQTLTGTTTSLTITPGMLQVTDSDSPDPNLTYTLTAVPSLTDGYFTLDGTRLVVGASFTQDDIASGRLSYTSLSTTPRIDSMSFTVKDGDRRLYPTPRDGGIYVPGTDTLAVNTFNINVQSTVPDPTPSRPTHRSMMPPAPAEAMRLRCLKARRSYSTTPNSPPPTRTRSQRNWFTACFPCRPAGASGSTASRWSTSTASPRPTWMLAVSALPMPAAKTSSTSSPTRYPTARQRQPYATST
jgi:hypothetical protein